MIARYAPAKLNLGLCVGAVREDGLHELCSLFAPLDLADELTITELESPPDEVVCEGVEGPDLSARALARLREEGWEGPPLRIVVHKRIPIAAGLGGGSADAAAVLRLALDEFGVDRLREIAADLGADVPSQVNPAFSLVGGAGEEVVRLPDPEPFSAVLLRGEFGLGAGEVYAEADRIGSTRSGEELRSAREGLERAGRSGRSPLTYPELLVNDLQPAAVSLQPAIEGRLEMLREAGAEVALVSGSGPTCVGLFADLEEAERAAGELSRAGVEPIVCSSLAGED